jgi:hypothetical protein
LRIGTKVVCRSDDYPQYATIRRPFKTMEEKRLKDAIKSGTLDCVGPDQRQNGGLQLADVVYDTPVPTTQAGRTGEPLPQTTLTGDADHGPMYSIRISELFPMMRNVQLPLYLISSEAPASIELTFNSQPTGDESEGTLACFPINTGDTSVALHRPSVKFLADFLTYDDNRMSALAQQVMSSQGMTIPYEDLVLTNTTFEEGANTVTATRRSQHFIGLDFNTTPMDMPNNGVQIGQKPVTMTPMIDADATLTRVATAVSSVIVNTYVTRFLDTFQRARRNELF